MAGQSHGDPLRDTGPNQVAHAAPAEIVRYVNGLDFLDSDLAVFPGFRLDVTGQTGVVAGARPCLTEARNALPIGSMEHPRNDDAELALCFIGEPALLCESVP